MWGNQAMLNFTSGSTNVSTDVWLTRWWHVGDPLATATEERMKDLNELSMALCFRPLMALPVLWYIYLSPVILSRKSDYPIGTPSSTFVISCAALCGRSSRFRSSCRFLSLSISIQLSWIIHSLAFIRTVTNEPEIDCLRLDFVVSLSLAPGCFQRGKYIS